jgi:hypothetical protein
MCLPLYHFFKVSFWRDEAMHTTHAPFACALGDSSILSKSAQASWVGFALERNLGTKQGVAPWTQCSGTHANLNGSIVSWGRCTWCPWEWLLKVQWPTHSSVDRACFLNGAHSYRTRKLVFLLLSPFTNYYTTTKTVYCDGCKHIFGPADTNRAI